METNNIEVYHPDVKVYEVWDGNRFMGVLYLDMHPRASKRSGAWKTTFREQSNIDGKQVRPLVQVVCNFSKPVGDKPALLSFDEMETFMHEMGHAMHCLLTDCTYPSLSGTSVKRDFVEMPSQVMENWCYEPAFLNSFARHYQTNDTIPGEYIRKIKEYAEAISDIFLKKANQRRNFDSELNKFDYNKFYDDAEKLEEWEEDYDDLDLRMLQNKYPKDNSNMRFNGQHLVNR